MKQAIETTYPITFREAEASTLGKYIQKQKSVVLIGMKRVGISNFLRFFLNHKSIDSTYIKSKEPQLFVQIDLNDLVERNISAFWTLLLTRVVDSVQNSTLPESEKRKCRRLFVQSIQLKDHFFTLESVRKVLDCIVQANISPTLFLIRFDRLYDVATPEFFGNMLGLREGTKQKLTYVFTSYRPLEELSPDVFKKQFLSVFSSTMYLPPTNQADMDIILATLQDQYHSTLDEKTRALLVQLSGGYVQYLQLSLIRLMEEAVIPRDETTMRELLCTDEQIVFQSEELFESLTKKEKDIVIQIQQGQAISKQDEEQSEYLWNTGIVRDSKKKREFFSPLFSDYVMKLTVASTVSKEFTKKEHLLFTYLSEHVNELCEREAIIEAVWPEHLDTGVSDWAIDRLVARLRSKLKTGQSPFQILTIVTRGYKLIKS